MGILSFLGGSNPIAAVADSTIGKVVGKLLDFIPDPVQKAAAQQAVLEMDFAEDKLQMDAAIAQINVNVEEAKSQSLFVAGWRPAVGWICALGLAYNYVLLPLMTFIAVSFFPDFMAPKLEIGELMTLLFGMLGLGAMRTVEKHAIITNKQ